MECIFRGGVYILEVNEEAKERIKKWANFGTENFDKHPLGVLGFKVFIREVNPTKLIMAFSNNTFLNFRLPFLIMFLIMARKVRRGYKIRFAKQIELYNIYETLIYEED